VCDRDASKMQNLSEDFNRRHVRPIRPQQQLLLLQQQHQPNDSEIHARLFPTFSRLHNIDVGEGGGVGRGLAAWAEQSM